MNNIDNSPLVGAAKVVDCAFDPAVYEFHLQHGTVEVQRFAQAAAGLFITTDEWRQADVELVKVFGPDASPEQVLMRPAILAESDQIRAYCAETLRALKPRLVELGVLKEPQS